MQKFLLYLNTIIYLKPIQIIGQLTKQSKLKATYHGDINVRNIKKDLHIFIPELDEDDGYLKRFDVEQILNNDICLLNEHRTLNLSDWKVSASPLWRFNLHYFEYCIPLGIQYKRIKDANDTNDTKYTKYYEKFKSFIDSWNNTHGVTHPDAWHPYTTSMRLPVWLICLELFEEEVKRDPAFEEKVYHSIYLQYRTLLKRQETWQLGNHYLENLKTIVLCSILFNEEDVYKKYVKILINEIKEEILDDGFHFELSPMYHRIILEDLIRVCYVLQQVDAEEYEVVKSYVQLTTNAMHSLEKGTERIPLFNDSGEGVAKSRDALLSAVKALFDIQPCCDVHLSKSGYYKLYSPNMTIPNITVVFDAGFIAPNYMPGHAHCDCLGFELFYKGIPVFVNSGTYQYQGKERAYFRSTAAHNTVVINGHEQSEIWGEHRVGRRISNVHAKLENNEIVGEYTNYLGEKHKRALKLSGNGLTVLDKTNRTGDVVKSYLHLAPNLKYCNGEIQGTELGKQLEIRVFPINASVGIEESEYSYAFGYKEKNYCLVFSWNNDDNDEKNHGYYVQFVERNLEN